MAESEEELKSLLMKVKEELICSHFATSAKKWWFLKWSLTTWIELDKAVVRVIRLTSFLWLWFQCICPLMPLATLTVLLGFLLPWTCGISSQLLQQSAATAPYLGWGVSPTAALPDLECGVAPLSPPAPCSHRSLEVGLLLSAAPLNLGMG